MSMSLVENVKAAVDRAEDALYWEIDQLAEKAMPDQPQTARDQAALDAFLEAGLHHHAGNYRAYAAAGSEG